MLCKRQKATKKWTNVQSIAGLQVTSRRPCWWSRTKALLSSGNETLFSCKLFEKKLYCIDPSHGHLVTWSQTKNRTFHSRDQHLYVNLLEQKKACTYGKEFNSYRIGLEHQHGGSNVLSNSILFYVFWHFRCRRRHGCLNCLTFPRVESGYQLRFLCYWPYTPPPSPSQY